MLKSGKWIKISTSGKGIYKIPYSRLSEWGFSAPSQVNVFGSGGTILSENPANIAYDDLLQVAVWHGQNNGTDCLFFYAPGTTEWTLNKGENIFTHRLNDYASKGFFFLTEEVGTRKTVAKTDEVKENATHQINSFDAFQLYEIEKYNLLPDGSGKQWFGDKFINGTTKNVDFDLSDLAEPVNLKIKINAAARSASGSEMAVNLNQASGGKIEFYRVKTDEIYGKYADEQRVLLEPDIQDTQLEVALKYFADNSNAEAWLDYIAVNYRRNLKLNNDVLFFRDISSAGNTNILEFTIENANSSTKVWDVSDLYNVKEVPLKISGSAGKGKRPAGELHEYAAFDTNGKFPEPELIGDVKNQNLHGLSTPEFLIITHPNFINSANALADFHRSYDGMDVEVVLSTQVYNEFSSGTKNATGIRNFIKMFYDRQEQLKYVLLFGDGSYDNKNVDPESSNFIPTYQSKNSLSPTESFVTDDYFVLLDDDENVYNGAVDLGIGRIPASTQFQAELVLKKIQNYYSPEALGNWRNIVSFIGDDEDGNLHMSQSEKLAEMVNERHRDFVTDKIYFDAYMQETTPAGERYPGVTEAINKRVKEGVLILNYVGHANARYLADEHVLDVSHINSWSNFNSLPVFVTATCEFSRFDADEMSAGEYILFNPNGGGIGLFSTTRLVYAWSNFQLSKSFYKYVFNREENDDYYRLGDIMRLAKTNTRNDFGINKRNFSLLADPALRLSYPKNKVVTTDINQQDASSEADTIGALQKVTVTGYVADIAGNKMSSFSGKMIPTVYDKAAMMKTRGNAGAKPMTFEVRENVIYKGLTSVTNGEFSFSFVIPKDISYSLGQGKIVYYAHNGETDANGAFDNFLIGGGSSSEIADNQGPQIDL
ncbi:MAG: type IX secretion system sortase PorU, partial [Prolixibacteraceae bacterium]